MPAANTQQGYAQGQRVRVVAQVVTLSQPTEEGKKPWARLRIPAWGGIVPVYNLADRFVKKLAPLADNEAQAPVLLVRGTLKNKDKAQMISPSPLEYWWFMVEVGDAALETAIEEDEKPSAASAQPPDAILAELQGIHETLRKLLLIMVDSEQPLVLPPAPSRGEDAGQAG